MRKSTALVLAGLGCMLSAGSVEAADMPQKKPVYVTVEIVTSGWYLRGDLGFRWNMLRRTELATGFPDADSNGLDANWFIGIGAGFKQGPVRVDVTTDYGSA